MKHNTTVRVSAIESTFAWASWACTGSIVTLFYYQHLGLSLVAALLIVEQILAWVASYFSASIIKKLGGKSTYLLGFAVNILGGIIAAGGNLAFAGGFAKGISVWLGFAIIEIGAAINSAGDTHVVIQSKPKNMEKAMSYIASYRSLGLFIGLLLLAVFYPSGWNWLLWLNPIGDTIVIILVAKFIPNFHDPIQPKVNGTERLADGMKLAKKKNTRNKRLETIRGYIGVLKQKDFTLIFLSAVLISSIVNQVYYYFPVKLGNHVAPIAFVVFSLAGVLTNFVVRRLKSSNGMFILSSIIGTLALAGLLIFNQFELDIILSFIFGLAGSIAVALVTAKMAIYEENPYRSTLISSISYLSNFIASVVMLGANIGDIFIVLLLIITVFVAVLFSNLSCKIKKLHKNYGGNKNAKYQR